MNKVILFGRLGADPEIRQTPRGTSVTNLRLATDMYYRDVNGESQQKTEWHTVVCWSRNAEVAGEYLRKGSQVLIEGHLETRKWQDQGGNNRYTTEIQCERLSLVGGGSLRKGGNERSGPSVSTTSPPADDFDDDIPF